MGTTKTKLGIFAYKNIPNKVIESGLNKLEDDSSHSPYSWIKEENIILFIRASKWLDGNLFDTFPTQLMEYLGNTDGKHDIRYEYLSFETSTDLVCYSSAKIIYGNNFVGQKTYEIDYTKAYNSSSGLIEILYHLTLDLQCGKEVLKELSFKKHLSSLEMKKEYQNREMVLLVIYLSFSEDDIDQYELRNEILSEKNTCVFSINNGYPLSFRCFNELEEYKPAAYEKLANLPDKYGVKNKTIVFLYSKETMELIPYFLLSNKGQPMYVKLKNIFQLETNQLNKDFGISKA